MRYNKILLLFLINLFLLASAASATVEGYYKDLFSDGGCRLGSKRSLPAVELLNLSAEYLATSKEDVQSQIIIEANQGQWKDDNGVLLYPDGAPRFRCLFSNGGKSINHGQSLGEIGRQRIRDFYANGGSYTGSCAGSAIVTIKTTSSRYSRSPREEYYHIWPARACYTQLAGSYTDIEIPKSSPLLKYYDFGGDFRIEHLRHNGGNFAIEDDNYWWCDGTEVLARFTEPVTGRDDRYRNLLGNVSAWAYKASDNSGRLAVCGSHPESVEDGEIRDFQAAMILYAMDGNGSPKVKATLENSIPIKMNNNSSKGFEKIGDLQYHHFKVDLPDGVKKLKVSVKGRPGVDMNLYLKRGGFAFKGRSNVIEARNSDASNELMTVDNPEAGSWFIGVKCNDSVKGEQRREFFEYTDNLNLLNGEPYIITASWIE